MDLNLRYLAALRLSSDSDASTAIERQLRGIEHYLAAPHVSGILAGIAEDTDVSGGLSPFKRPNLGRWLKQPDEFDVIIAYKLDRLTRRSLHFNELLKWCQDNGKWMVCVEEGFDLSAGPGKMMAQIAAVFAEAEWDAIQARVVNGVRTRLENRSWLVGAPPTGYRIKTVECEKRKVLEVDPAFEPIVKEIFGRVMGGQSTHKIAKDLNVRGVLTWSDHVRAVKGEQTKGTQWQAVVINKFIRSNWVPGIYTYKVEMVLDDEGEPVVLPTAPLASIDEWHQLIKRIEPKVKSVGVRVAKSLLAGVAKCGECGSAMARVKSSGALRKDGTRAGGKFFYRCTSRFRGGKCAKGGYIESAKLDGYVNDAVITVVGQWEMFERAAGGPSVTQDLEAAQGRLAKLEGDFLSGKYDGEGQEDSYWRMHRSLTGKIVGLEKLEAKRRRPVLTATGQLYRDVWAAKDEADRREFLREYGVTAWVWRDAVPGKATGDRDNVIVDMGDIGRMAGELKLLPGTEAEWARWSANVPGHWVDASLLDSPEGRSMVMRSYGTVEVPHVLQERRKAPSSRT